MYDFLKTPEQRKRENKQALMVTILIIGIPFMIILIISLFTKEFSNNTNSKRGACATITESYSYMEHNVYCDGDYDWIDQMAQDGLDADYQQEQKYEAKLRAQQAEEEYYNYCYQNNWDC